MEDIGESNSMVSVIIPTLNAERYIHGLISSLKRQTLKPEIIVIDSSSSDNTVGIADSLGAKTKIIVRGCFDHGGTRNTAVKLANGDILVFVTQDAMPVDEYLIENLIAPLKEPDIPASYGRQIPKDDAKPTERFSRLFNYPDKPFINDKEGISKWGIRTFFFSNVCSAIRRKEFEEIGGFTEGLIMNEDMLLASRLIMRGYRIAYVHQARVIHSHNYSWLQQFRRYFDIGTFLRMGPGPLSGLRIEDTGIRFLVEEIRYLVRNRSYTCLPRLLVETISKFIGYKLGYHHNMLPLSLRRSFSMHTNYWIE
ncbi:MAG: O antigen biosynthesis rhamnosyltransferase RfbN [Thermodesulfovibrionia bacterium]